MRNYSVIPTYCNQDFRDECMIRVGEQNSLTLDITVPEDFDDFDCYINYKLNENATVLSAKLDVVDGKITFPIISAMTSEIGILKLELIGKISTTTVLKSGIMIFEVRNAL